MSAEEYAILMRTLMFTQTIRRFTFSVTKGRGDVVIEVQMEEEKFTVESPFAVFIPPGVKHCFTVLKCDSPNYVFGIHVLDYKK